MAALTAYVRKTGSDNNGGSSVSTSPDKTATDGVTNGTTTFTSASALFVAGDVDKLIQINTKSRYRIVGYTNSTTITLSGSPSAGSGLTWAIGGAVQTIGAVVESATIDTDAIKGGDTIWIGPGIYRELITFGLDTPASELRILGDVTGVNTGDPAGPVVLSAYLTDDDTAPSASQLWQMAGARNYLTIEDIVFISGTGQVVGFSSGTNINLRRCVFFSMGTSACIGGSSTFGVAMNWTIEDCIFWRGPSTGYGLSLTLPTGTGSDYDVNVLFRNCLFLGAGSACVTVAGSGASANKGGGVRMRNCMSTNGIMLQTSTSTLSTSIPCELTNSYGWSSSAIVSANTSGQITEDYNAFYSATPRTNVTAGSNSRSDYSPSALIHMGQELWWGGRLRPIGEPMGIGSGLLGFGNDGNQKATDLLGRPRPAGGASALAGLGPLERGNTWAKETSIVRDGSSALGITGPGYQDFQVPVDAASTTVSVYMRCDSTYAGTKPQIQVLDGEECGVSDATSAAVTLPNVWEQLSLTFTPTSKGIVTIRLLSSDTNGGGKAYADTIAVA